MTALGANARIDSARLWDSLMEMARIGPGIAGGNNRQTLTDADSEGRHLFKRWCEAAGCTMGVDTMGNMFATRPGTDPAALPVYIGSHLDTQPTGGKFDGVLGVLAGLEVVRSMNDLGIKTKHPVVVTNWTNEEGARFAPAMLASGVFAGILTEDYAKARTDSEGLVFGDELQRIGWVGDEKVGARKMHAMFEYHIEQGPILEAEGKEIGVVTHGQGLWWLEITLTGKDAHTGSTPMNMRVNAGLGMARITERVHQIAMAHQPNAVGAVGQVKVFPNSRNVIPGKVRFTLDVRAPEDAMRHAAIADIRAAIETICARRQVAATITKTHEGDVARCAPWLQDAIASAIAAEGLGVRRLPSGAGHDGMAMISIADIGMLFVRCREGISHNPREAVSPADIEISTRVFARFIEAFGPH